MEYCVFSVCRSFYIGVSIWTPWRNIFSRLPKRIFSKIISVSGDKNIKSKLLVSQVWNSIIISMYREHLISLEHVQKLIYKQIDNPGVEGDSVLKEPIFCFTRGSNDKVIIVSRSSRSTAKDYFCSVSINTYA